MPQFGEMLRELREERRLTQIDLANAMHISSSSISAYEIGASLPPMERALELADFLKSASITCLASLASGMTSQF